MSKPDWQWPLGIDEELLWEGRPAPRCYTFRNWKLAAAGTVLFLACSFWMMLGYELVKSEGYSMMLVVMTAPLVVASFLLGPGHLILSRWRWEKIFYALSDQRLFIRSGLLQTRIRAYPVQNFTRWQRRRFGEELASIRILRGDDPPLIIACIEQPGNLTRYLPNSPLARAGEGESV